MKYHVSPDGPRKCEVDENNPRSRGCDYARAGQPHFDSIENAETYYQEQLSAAFGVIEPIRVGRKVRNTTYKTEENVRAAASAVKEAPRNVANATKAKFNGIKADVQTSKAFTAISAMYKDSALKAKTARDSAHATARAKFNSLRESWNEEAEAARTAIRAREESARLNLEQRQRERDENYARKQMEKSQRAEERAQMLTTYRAYIKAESKQKFANLFKGGIRAVTNVKEFAVGDHYSAKERIASIRDMGNGSTRVTLVDSSPKAGAVGRHVMVDNKSRLHNWVRRNSVAAKSVGYTPRHIGTTDKQVSSDEAYNKYFKPVHQSQPVGDTDMDSIRKSLSLINQYGYKDTNGKITVDTW